MLATAWTLRATTFVTLPLAFALFIAVSVWPVCDWVRERVTPRLDWLGYAAAMLLVVALLSLFVGGLAAAAQQIAERFLRGPARLDQQIERGLSRSGLPGIAELREQLAGVVEQFVRTLATYVGGFIRATLSTIAGVVLIFFLVLLMLIEARTWHAKLTNLGASGERRWDEAIAAIGQRFRRYFLARLLLGVITGLLCSAWLALFGVDLLLVWGLLAFLLNFVPTVGSLIAGILPVIYVLVTREPGTAALVAGGLLVIEQIMGNYVDPRLLGSRLAVSPLVILVALLVWSWIWGAAGALIAVPLTVLILVVCAYFPPLRPIALLLGNEGDLAALDRKITPG